jgi:hypothetical protein
MKDVFTQYYEMNQWGALESKSGPGSILEHTDTIRKAIPEIIEKYKIGSILDAACGDYNWFKWIKRTIPYIGIDIVEKIIDQNNLLYQNDITRFISIDITKDLLPVSDLVICREAMQHWSNADIRNFLDNFLKSENKYLLTTNCGIGPNEDIKTGQYRFLNLHAEPLNFGLPLEVISEWNWPSFPPKTLNLYARDAIK